MEPWGAFQQVLPDYSLSITEVYRDFTALCIFTTRTLDFLSLVQDQSLKQVEGLPTWVSDYSVNLEGRAAPLIWPTYRRVNHPNYYSASGEIVESIGWSPSDPSILKVSGHCFDTIACIANLENKTPSLVSQAKEWKGMMDRIQADIPVPNKEKPRSTLPRSEFELYQGLWRKDMGMVATNDPTPPRLPMIKSWVNYIRDQMTWYNKSGIKPTGTSGKNWQCFLIFLFFIKVQQCSARTEIEIETLMLDTGITVESFPHLLKYKDDIMALIKGVVIGRRTAITEKGRIALVPISAQEGDMLYLFRGGRVPYLVRGDRSRMRLSGEAFVWDVMYGAAADLSGDEEWHLIDLE
jgi:hypothetical protein